MHRANIIEEGSICKYMPPIIDFKNSSLLQIAKNINGFSKNRYQYIGSDTAKYTFSIYINKLNDSLNSSNILNTIYLYNIGTYINKLFLTISDKYFK